MRIVVKTFLVLVVYVLLSFVADGAIAQEPLPKKSIPCAPSARYFFSGALRSIPSPESRGGRAFAVIDDNKDMIIFEMEIGVEELIPEMVTIMKNKGSATIVWKVLGTVYDPEADEDVPNLEEAMLVIPYGKTFTCLPADLAYPFFDSHKVS